jgi:ATP-dependent Clp protease adaptor protein ClpS
MATIYKEKAETELDEILSQPYVIILHNDDYNTFDWVIECLMKICKHEFEQANQCAHIVHFRGKCDVKRGDQETLNKMYQKLKAAGLSATMEIA